MKKSEKTVESGPFPGTSLIGSKYMHGKRNTDGTPPVAIPFKFIQADDKAGLLALIESDKHGAQWVIDRFNYGSTLKEQAAVTPSATGSDKARAKRAEDHLDGKAMEEITSGNRGEYFSMWEDKRKLAGKAREEYMLAYAVEEGVL